jgi:uncharacterized protein with HEPN domain
MIEMCELLTRHAADSASRDNNPVVQAAAQRWIEVLGEAASHVSDATRVAHPEIPWRDIAGTRIILAHAYFHVDRDIVGRVIERDIPDLAGKIRVVLGEFSADE